jgi:predicted glycoside hydrolase/deacetylase ChbG (UPF0249 family)
MKRFMFVADDFGMSAEVNRAVELACRAGAIRLVSLMVTGNAAEQAVAIARGCPGMTVGLHLVVDGLIGVDPVVWTGARCEGLSELVAQPSLRDSMAHECERQIETYFSLGFAPTFLNSHFHVHTIPSLFDLFVELARAHGFTFLRFSPHDPLLAHPDLPISGGDLASMALRLADQGIKHADWYKPTFCYLYPPELSTGLTEIAFHPAWGDSEIGYLDLVRLLSWGSILRSSGSAEFFPETR